MPDPALLQATADIAQETYPFVGKSAADEIMWSVFGILGLKLGRPAVMGYWLDRADGDADATPDDPAVYDRATDSLVGQAWLAVGVVLTAAAVWALGGVTAAVAYAGVLSLVLGLLALWAYRRRRSQRDVDVLKQVL